MALGLLLLFLIIPTIEIALYIEVGDLIGVWPTVGLTFLTAIAGSIMLRWQGLSTLRRVQDSLARNEMPLGEALQGVLLLLAGLLLLIPGFFTDTIGLLLFITPLRALLALLLLRQLEKRGGFTMRGTMGPGAAGVRRPGQGGGPTIDGDYHDVTPGPDGGGSREGGNPVDDGRSLPAAGHADSDTPGTNPGDRRG